MKKTLTQRVTELETKLYQKEYAEQLSKAIKDNPLPKKIERPATDKDKIDLALISISDALYDIHNLVFWTSLVNSTLLVIIIVLLLNK